MDGAESLLLFKFILLAGLAMWTSIEVLSLLGDFPGAVKEVGLTMSMRLLGQPPPIQTRLSARRVESRAWHRAGAALLTLLAGISAILLWGAAIAFLVDLITSPTATATAATVWANLGLCAFAVMAFFLAVGGEWFADFMRQEGLQTMHLVLIGLAAVSIIVVNLPLDP